MASELTSDLGDTVGWDREWLVDVNTEKLQLVLFDLSNNFDTFMRKGLSLSQTKSGLLRCWDCFSVSNWIGGSCNVVIAKITSEKIGALISSVKSLTSTFVLYLHKSCSLAWNAIVI